MGPFEKTTPTGTVYSVPRRLWGTAVALAALVLASAPALATDDEFPYAGERHTRISLIQGDVMIQRGDDDGWAYASLNLPLRPGDRLWATEDSRCEVQVSGGTVIRFAENTNVDILSLEADFLQLDITYGVASFRVRERNRGGILEVATPLGAIEVEEADFRVDIGAGEETEITVRSGYLDIESVAGPVRVHEGEIVTLSGGDSPRFAVASAPPFDSWDRWCIERGGQISSTASRRYVEVQDPWVADLDLYGSWTTVETYGTVWIPAVRVGWAPYRDGRWLWVEPWGWTWVAHEPWGWGPYHYGRWVHLNRRGWAWIPGRHPVWIPGNARFVYGPSWVGWVPLGHRDRYYYRSPGHTQFSFSVTNYAAIGGITIVSNVGFLSGDYERHRVSLHADQIRAAAQFTTRLPLKPVRASLYPYVQRPVRTVQLPPRRIERAVVHLRTPARVPQSFSERHRAVEHRTSEVRRVPVRKEAETVRTPPGRSRPGKESTVLRSTVVKKSQRAVRTVGQGTGREGVEERESVTIRRDAAPEQRKRAQPVLRREPREEGSREGNRDEGRERIRRERGEAERTVSPPRTDTIRNRGRR